MKYRVDPALRRNTRKVARIIAMSDEPRRDDADRYALYCYRPGQDFARRICATSLAGIGGALVQMIEEDEIERGCRVGILDRRTRDWLINPYL